VDVTPVFAPFVPVAGSAGSGLRVCPRRRRVLAELDLKVI